MTMIGKRIEAARLTYGWSQEELGKMVGVSKASVSAWERGASDPKWQKYDRLAEIFDCSPEWFQWARGRAPSGHVMVKVYTIAHVPGERRQAWLQHLRDFDSANAGCHFEVAVDAPDLTLGEMVEKLQVTPGLTFQQIFERRQED
jgi:transcriptional regulator with XRE-family HTH domain